MLSVVGYLALKISKPRTEVDHSVIISDFDLFFTSVSSTTVSSMSTVEMESFSNTQLIIITILMLLGGEVFTSMLGLLFVRSKFTTKHSTCALKFNQQDSCPTHSSSEKLANGHQILELGNYVSDPIPDHSDQNIHEKQNIINSTNLNQKGLLVSNNCIDHSTSSSSSTDHLKYNSIRCLGYVVLGYLVVVHLMGSGLLSLYVSVIPSARQVLKAKGLKIQTFSALTMILAGNTLYPPCLRLLIWVLDKITRKGDFKYMLKNYNQLGYDHLLSADRCCLLAITVFGFIGVQLILFCSMEWNSGNMDGLNWYQKIVASLFQTVNSRNTGESVFDLSSIPTAILVLFVVMMYLPPYTTFLGIRDQEQYINTTCTTGYNEYDEKQKKQSERMSFVDRFLFSQLAYLGIFIILICITERENLKQDPLNYNVLNITIEVISAYGNVGFTTGYSCERKLKMKADAYDHDIHGGGGLCKDSWVGFVGHWSFKGKFILILVMFFGRLKKFTINTGKAWHLS
ncbi:Cation transporter [Quillaja saponaria]|uniref:Cation transporter n=1 Tax=Quillaja saponaria TaxID=32244 RepID=A0AAD7Q2Q5_QUISA|nr:Cation transporter [Quillaja saponaria]